MKTKVKWTVILILKMRMTREELAKLAVYPELMRHRSSGLIYWWIRTLSLLRSISIIATAPRPLTRVNYCWTSKKATQPRHSIYFKSRPHHPQLEYMDRWKLWFPFRSHRLSFRLILVSNKVLIRKTGNIIIWRLSFKRETLCRWLAILGALI